MPQYEVELPPAPPRRLRARDAQDAAVRAGVESPLVLEEADVQGWREIVSHEEVVGRVREHHRMRFRRD